MALKQKQKNFKRKGVKKMKKFTKLFLSCAMVSALAASTAVMASAAPTSLVTDKNGLAGTYEDGVLDLDLTKLDGGIDTTQQATLLVVKGTAYTDDASVVGIDQAAGADFDMTGLKGAPTEDTADDNGYTVMVGYYTAGESSKFQIASATLFAPEATGETFKIGDTDFDDEIDGFDATYILRKGAGLATNVGNVGDEYKFTVAFEKGSKAVGTSFVIGDTDLDNETDGFDATYILRKGAGLATNVGYVGEEVTAAAVAE